MKQILLTAMVVLVAWSVSAQPAISKGKENKSIHADKISGGQYVGQYGGLDCYLFEGKKHSQQFTVVDLNFDVQRSVELPQSNQLGVLATSFSQQVAGILVADQSSKKRAVVGRYRVDLDSVAVIGGKMDTLLTYDIDKKDDCKLWSSVSPSGNRIALVVVVKNTEQMQYRTHIALYDGAMNKLWTQEFALGSVSDIMVDDKGRIVTLGLEPNAEEQGLVFNLLYENYARNSKLFVKCDPIRNMHLATINGNHVIAVGDYGIDGGKKLQHISSGIIALSFSLDSAAITNFTMRPFTNEDINILYNEKSKKIQKDLRAEGFEYLDAVPMPYGCAALFGRRYRIEYTNSAGMAAYDYSCVGLHCVAVDTLGTVRWVHNIRRNAIQHESNDMTNINLVEANGQVGLVATEHKKSPIDHVGAKPIKELELGAKGSTMLYTIAEDGEMTKILLEKGTKQHVIRSLRRNDGALLLLSSDGKRSRAAELKFVY